MDPTKLQKNVEFILKQQDRQGWFQGMGTVHHKEMQVCGWLGRAGAKAGQGENRAGLWLAGQGRSGAGRVGQGEIRAGQGLEGQGRG